MGPMVGGSVVWILDADTGEFSKAMIQAEGQADRTGRAVDKSLSQGFQGATSNAARALDRVADALGGIIKTAAAVGITGAFGIGAMATAAFQQVRAVEAASFGLKAYEKDADKVNQVLGDLVKYARSDMGVLFQREELFKSATNLKLFGVETDKLVGYTEILSKGVALGYTSFDELSSILGETVASGQLTGDAFDMLQRRAIKLPDSMRGAKVSAEELFEALDKSLPDAILEGRANTIDGALIRLQSAFRDLGSDILGVDKDTSQFIEGGLGDRFMGILSDLREQLRDPVLKQAFVDMGQAIGDFAEEAVPVILDAFQWLAANFDKLIEAAKILVPLWIALKLAAAGLHTISTISGVFGAVGAGMKTASTMATGFKYGLLGIKGAAQGVKSAQIGAIFGNIAKIMGGVFKTAIGLVTKGIGLLVKGFLLLGKAMLANPISIVIVAIIALVAGFIWLWNNVEGFRNFFIGVWDAIKGAAQAVADWFTGTLVPWLQGAWDTIVEAVTSFANGVAEVWNSIVTTVTMVVEEIWNAVVTVFTAIWNFISPILEFILNIFIIVFGTILIFIIETVTAIWNIISTIFTTVWTFLTMVWTAIWTTIVTIATAIWNAIVTYFTAVWNTITTIFNAVWGVITTVWNAVWDTIVTVATAIWDTISTVWNAIWGVISSVLQWVWDKIVAAFNFYKNIITTVLGAIWGVITTVWNNVYSKISTVVDNVKNFISTGFNAAKDLATTAFNRLKTAVGDAIDGAKQKVTDVIDGIKNLFSDAGTWLFEAGKSIMKGLGDGIANMAESVKGKAEEVMAKIRDLMPFSPAKEGPFSGKGWTLYSGRSIVEGLAEGMKKSQGSAVQSALAVAQAINGTMQAAGNMRFDMEGDVAGINTTSRLAGSNIGTADSAATPTTNTYNITLPNVENAQDFAREFKRAMVGRG